MNTTALEQLTATARFLGRTISRWLNGDQRPPTVGFVLMVIDTENAVHTLSSNMSRDSVLELLAYELQEVKAAESIDTIGDVVGHA